MVFDDPLHNSQADAGSLSDLLCGGEPFEDLEDLIKIVLVDADSVITDKKHSLAVMFFDAHVNPWQRVVFAYVLHCIGQQIVQDLAQPLSFDVDDRELFLDIYFDTPFLDLGLKRLKGVLDKTPKRGFSLFFA